MKRQGKVRGSMRGGGGRKKKKKKKQKKKRKTKKKKRMRRGCVRGKLALRRRRERA